MTTNFRFDSFCNQEKKNIKNIYVQKINSLMKLSKDTVLKDDYQSSTYNEKKKFKKTTSELDKNTLKLQKNRESAKKARLRKKIYIKMLQSQIQCFKRIKNQGEQLNEQSQSFLTNKKTQINDIEMNELISHNVNVDKFLSGSDLGQVLKIENKEFEKKLKQRDGIVEELYQLSTSSLIKKLKGAKNLQVFHPILKKQARQNTANFQNLINRISHHYDLIKNSFRKVHQLTEKSKNLNRKCKNQGLDNYVMGNFASDMMLASQFMGKLNLNRQCEFNKQFQQKGMMDEQNCHPSSTFSQKSLTLGNDFNLHSTQKLLIRSEKFFQHTFFQEEQ